MEDYNKNPLGDTATKHSGGTKTLLTITALVLIVVVFSFLAAILSSDQMQFGNDGSVSDTAPLNAIRVGNANIDISDVPKIVERGEFRDLHDLRKVPDHAIYQQRVDEALAAGLENDWAFAQIDLAESYLVAGGKENAKRAADILKEVVENPGVNKKYRAIAVRDIGGMYCRSGLNPDILDIVYSGKYADFFRERDPLLAQKRVAEVSYEVFPNSRAAVAIAHYYGEILAANTENDFTQAELEDARDNALTQLRNAEVLARDEYDPNHVSAMYVSYLFWRALTYGQIAVEFESYIDDAEQAYDDLFAYITPYYGTYSTTVIDIIPFAHLRYANFMMNVYGDSTEDAIVEQLEGLMTFVNDDPQKGANVFVKYLNNQKTVLDRTGKYSDRLEQARGYSSAYDAFLAGYGLPAQN